MKRSRETVEEDSFGNHNGYSPLSLSPNDTRIRSGLNDSGGLPAKKLTGLDSESAIDDTDSGGVDMKCSLPGHGETLSFKTYDEYQSHYQKSHTNRCLDCRKNFPSSHLLSVHIEECHDSFVVVKREKGEHTYSCFVEGCERKCRTPQKRRLHLIDKHMYPRNYYFAVTLNGIDGRSSLLVDSHQRRRSSAAGTNNSKQAATKEARRRSNQMEAVTKSPAKGATTSRGKQDDAKAESESDSDSDSGSSASEDDKTTANAAKRSDIEMDGLAGAMSALQFVPHSVKFGRGGSKAGFSRR